MFKKSKVVGYFGRKFFGRASGDPSRFIPAQMVLNCYLPEDNPQTLGLLQKGAPHYFVHSLR